MRMDRSFYRCVGIFLTTVIFGVALRCGASLWDGLLPELFAPRNTSVWELSKIGFWPSVAAVLLWHIGRRDRAGLCAYLMVPAAMPVALLFVYWFLHLVCGICSAVLDASVWVCLLAVGNFTAMSLRTSGFARQALAMVCVIVLLWAAVYTVFSLHPAALPIFTETMCFASVIGW